MFKLKISMSIVMVLMLSSSMLYGSDSTSLAHTWALQFRISSNFMLSSFQGSNLSAQYYLKDNRAIRTGFSLSGNTNDSEIDRRTTGKSEREQNGFTLVVFSQYLIYPKEFNRINPYFGFGPYFTFSTSFDKITLYSQDMDIVTNDAVSLGLLSSIGGEVYVCDGISLTAEYGTRIYYQSSKLINTDKNRMSSDDSWVIVSQSKETSQGLKLNYESVLFGVSIHF